MLDGLFGGMIGLGSDLLNNTSSARQAANSLQAQERGQERGQAWQERMTGTAHQREVADLRAAGLNPILSGTGGMGAQSGSGGGVGGAQGQVTSGGAMAGYSSAVAAARVRQEEKLLKEQTEKAAYDKRIRENEYYMSNNDLRMSNAKDQHWERYRNADLRQREADAELTHNAVPGSRVESDIDKGWGGHVSRYLQRFIPAVNSAVSAARGMRAR